MARKKWNLLPDISQDLKNQNKKTNPLLLQLLSNRGLRTGEEIDFFLGATYDKDSFDPFLFVEMKEAIELLISHIKSKNKIVIYGDYDADGVSSTALLVDAFRSLKIDVDYYIPHRSVEGYGINKQAAKKIADSGAKLIITVDNGIRNKAEVEYIKSLGIDCIITDHHQGPENDDELPDCIIINPTLKREKKVYDKLAGVGVALKFMEALIKSSKLPEDLKKRLADTLFDMAALGTVADCVSLHGENRLIVKKGLEVISSKPRLGLDELIDVSAIKEKSNIDTWNIGFQIAPRINAAGRMKHANTALFLMLSKDKKEAHKLAQELNYNNQMRQKSTEEIFDNVVKQMEDQKDKFILIATYQGTSLDEEPWNEGIIGLVSGRITEKYHKPSLVITETEDGYKGSGRSIDEFDIVKALEQNSSYLEKYGGHPMACGFSLKKKDLPIFKSKMSEYAQKMLSDIDLRPSIYIDAELDFDLINLGLIEMINSMKPYGQDNPQPIFLSKNILIVDKLEMGLEGQHLRLRVKNGSSNIISALGFNQSLLWKDLKIGDQIDIVYNLDINEYNGRRDPQLKIIDIKNHE